MSNPHMNLAARFSKLARGPVATVVLVVLTATPAEAGSVFMKNGYILQGNIVDRDPVSIVMGWPNGTVTIARRFVSTIVFDATEEQQLQELETTRRELAGEATDAARLFLESPDETRELPATLEGFMRTFNVAAPVTEELTVADPLMETPAVTIVEPVTVVEQPIETQVEPTVTVETRPSPRLEDDFFHAERLGIALRPPTGWVPMVLDNAVVMKGSQDEAGFSPSLSVVAFEVGALSPAKYADLLKAEQEVQLKAHHLIEERVRSYGGTDGPELVASGRFNGREAIVRQGLVVLDGKVWLFSGVTQNRDEDGPFDWVDESLATLNFETEHEQQ
jgi:hypothetical protein